jgi:predicted ATPase
MTRRRLIKAFSFQEADRRALEASRARLHGILPGATESETVRLALHLLKVGPLELLKEAASHVVRMKTGRPPSVARLPIALTRCLEEDQRRRERVELLEVIHRLEKQDGEETKKQLAILYARLEMVPVITKRKSS